MARKNYLSLYGADRLSLNSDQDKLILWSDDTDYSADYAIMMVFRDKRQQMNYRNKNYTFLFRDKRSYGE